MVVRLGFAATTLRPDILITDEVLAVGDESFQKNASRGWRAILRAADVLLCSHAVPSRSCADTRYG
jgi:lipopolysaccharide transport system ATP-binding protein